MNKTNCISCKNMNCLIKKHIEKKNIKPFIEQKTTFACQSNQQFILEGAPVSGLHFIYSGKVKVYKQTDERNAQIIRFSTDGEIVGHRGFGTNYVYDISASALTNAVLCHFGTDVLIEMLHKTPEMMFDFMLFYADQLQKSESNAKRFGKMTVRDKVINGLLFIHNKFGQSNGLLKLILSRKDMADFAGISPEQVTREISTLKKEGLLIRKGKRIGITDIPRIEKKLSQNGYFLEG